MAVLLMVGACGGGPAPPAGDGKGGAGLFDVTAAEPAAPPPVDVYAATAAPVLSPQVADIPARVFVPNSGANTVQVIDPATFQVIDSFRVDATPHHITPAWDLRELYVNNTDGNTLTVIDPRSGRPVRTIPVTDPYNLYFTVDGKKAIVVAERYRRLDFRDPNSWELIKSVPVPWPGVDHLDFSADGRYLLASTEFSGRVVKVDTQTMEVVADLTVGSQPIDVKIAPDGSVFYVTNQGRHGVSVVDGESMKELEFIDTAKGAHGLTVSRDAKSLFVSNRLAGSVSKIDLATRRLVATSAIGGSPDMLQVSPDGRQLWVSNRYHAAVTVLDTASGELLKVIPVGKGAHGLTYFPQPGRFSIGHNGVYR